MQNNPTPEQAVLGAALIRPSAYAEAALLLTADDFEKPSDRAVFKAMGTLVQRGSAIDYLALEDELKGRGEGLAIDGGMHYIVELADSVPHAENVRHYAEIVARRAALRRLRLAASLIAERAEDNPEEAQRLVLETQRLVTEIQRGRARPGVELRDLVQPMLDELESRTKARGQGGGKLVGLSTGISSLDYLTCGLRNGTLNIIAARTSLGKTAYACQLALLGAVHSGTPALFFSLEMRPMELAERFFSRLAGIDSDRLRSGDLDMDAWKRLQSAGAQMSERGPVTISNTRALGGILTEARAFRVRNPDRPILLVVDYLQLVRSGQRRTREQEVAEVSGALKEIAVELDCPVVAPVQFNRGPEGEDREPQLTDIRESGAIENDADLVMFILRKRDDKSGACWIKVAKHRNGQLGEVEVQWHGATYELRDVEQQQGWS